MQLVNLHVFKLYPNSSAISCVRKKKPLTKCQFALLGCGGVTRDVFDAMIQTDIHFNVYAAVNVSAAVGFSALSLFVWPFLCLPPDGEVAALKGEVDHLDDCDRRRAHPEADTTVKIKGKLRIL